MTWSQHVRAPVTCIACGQRVDAWFYFPSPRPEADGPYEIEVGAPLGFDVSDYDLAFVELRQRANPEAGRVIVDWSCDRCARMWWALASLGDRDGVPSLLAVEPCPISSATVAAADWINELVLQSILVNVGVRFAGAGDRLTAIQIAQLGELLDQYQYPPSE